MAGIVRRDRFDFLPEQFRKFVEGEWDTSWMRVEEFQDGGTLVVRAELPGIDPENDVDITVAEGVLHIKAERRERTENKDKSGYRSEFRYGALTRSITLPSGASQDDISAAYRDGVLEVRMRVPEAGAGTTTKIPVTRA